MFAIITIVFVVAAGVAVAGHFLLFGPKHPECAGQTPSVLRFRLWERLMHGATVLSFLVLTGTGFSAILAHHRLSGIPLLLHWCAAPFFALGVAAMALFWAGYGRFEPFDLDWFRVSGGYLGGGHDSVPAGRFNAGQKAFYWLILGLGAVLILSGALRIFPLLDPQGQAIVLWLHRGAALILACAILAHAYLGTFANPGTLQAMVTGRVSPGWAWGHHPVWARRHGLPRPAPSPKKTAPAAPESPRPAAS